MSPDHLRPEHVLLHRHFLAELAQAREILARAEGAVGSWMRYVGQEYGLAPTDQVTFEGAIVRSEAPAPPGRIATTEFAPEPAFNGDVP
jgi:hypothetical protein